MKNKGGREAGKCSKVVPDRGDRCLFIFLWNRHLFCNIFPFPVCKAQLIGDWHENRWGAPNPIIFLIIRQYIGAPKPPAPIVMADRTQKKIREILLAHHAWSGLPIGGGGHRCANILAHRSPCSITNNRWKSVYFTKNWSKVADRTFRCASPIFMTIAY